MKAAIYSIIGNKKGQDTEDQLAQLRHRVLSKHGEVYLFVDRHSGKTSERAELQKLFASAARREFQAVLVWALDRGAGAHAEIGAYPSWHGDGAPEGSAAGAAVESASPQTHSRGA